MNPRNMDILHSLGFGHNLVNLNRKQIMENLSGFLKHGAVVISKDGPNMCIKFDETFLNMSEKEFVWTSSRGRYYPLTGRVVVRYGLSEEVSDERAEVRYVPIKEGSDTQPDWASLENLDVLSKFSIDELAKNSKQ